MQEANLHRPLRGGRGEGLEYCRRGNIVLKMFAACKARFPKMFAACKARFPMVKNQNRKVYSLSITQAIASSGRPKREAVIGEKRFFVKSLHKMVTPPSPFYEAPIYFFRPFFERKKEMILKVV